MGDHVCFPSLKRGPVGVYAASCCRRAILAELPSSSSGPGRRPFKAVARVRIPLGAPLSAPGADLGPVPARSDAGSVSPRARREFIRTGRSRSSTSLRWRPAERAAPPGSPLSDVSRACRRSETSTTRLEDSSILRSRRSAHVDGAEIFGCSGRHGEPPTRGGRSGVVRAADLDTDGEDGPDQIWVLPADHAR